MRIEDLNWMDVENYLETDDRLILSIGATEQHGFLSLTSDNRLIEAVADAASKKTGVLVAPSLNFGSSPYFLDYPGTFSLRMSTLMDAIEDLVRSAHKHGFRRILILNGHGGNEGARARLSELINDLQDLNLAWYSWFTSHSVQAICENYDIKPTHGSWLEAFPFNIVSDLPNGTKKPPYIAGLLNSKKAKEAYGDGNFGGKYKVNDEIMQELFEAILQDVITLLDFTGF